MASGQGQCHFRRVNAKNVMRRAFPSPIEVKTWSRKLGRRDAAGRVNPDYVPGKKLNVTPAGELAKRPELVVARGVSSRKLALVPVKVTHSPPRPAMDRGNEVAGRILGIVACSCVAAWWLNVLLAMVSSRLLEHGDSLWHRVSVPMFFVGLLGSHFPAVIGRSFLRSQDPWGTRAVVAFWGSLLIWVPLGWLLAVLGGMLP